MNRAALIAFMLLACAVRLAAAAALADKVAKIDQPAILEEVVKVGESAVPDLCAALNGPRADLAVLALGKIRSKQSVAWLLPLLKSNDGELRANAVWAIGQCGAPDAASAVIALMEDPYSRVRTATTTSLAAMRSAEGDAAMRRAVVDVDESVRMAAVQSLRTNKRADLFTLLLPRLQFHIEKVLQKVEGPGEAKEVEKVVWSEPSAQVRLAIVVALSELKCGDALPALIGALERESSFNRQAIIRAIEKTGPGAAGACLGRIVPLAYDKETFAKHMPVLISNGTLAVIAGHLGDDRCTPALLETLKLPRGGLGNDKDLTELYIQSTELLGKFKCERAGRPLAELLKDARVRQLSEAVQKAIEQIGRPAARPLARNMDDWSLAPIFLRLLRQPELRTPVARDGILKFLSHESDEVRLAATETLGLYLLNGIMDEYDLPALDAMYLDPNREVRATCRRWQEQIAKKLGSEVSQ